MQRGAPLPFLMGHYRQQSVRQNRAPCCFAPRVHRRSPFLSCRIPLPAFFTSTAKGRHRRCGYGYCRMKLALATRYALRFGQVSSNFGARRLCAASPPALFTLSYGAGHAAKRKAQQCTALSRVETCPCFALRASRRSSFFHVMGLSALPYSACLIVLAPCTACSPFVQTFG
jgi:hypothetical protein